MKKFGQYLKEAEEKPLSNVEIGDYEDEADPETGKIYSAEDLESSTEPEKRIMSDKEGIKKGVETLQQIINLPYDEFIQKLTGKTPPTEGKTLAEIDPKVQQVLKLGRMDLKLEDEKVPVNDKAVIPVKSLFPTQSQIGLLDSIGFLAFILPDAVKNSLSGQAEFKGERILTANGKYILDGHHRWSQTYIINPDAKIPALDLTLNVKDEKEMLKVIQLAIAKTYGKIAMKAANAETDIYNDAILKKWNSEYNIEGDTTLGLVKAILDGKCDVPEDGDIKNVETFVKIIQDTKKLGSKEEVEKYLATNADTLRKNNGKPDSAPARAIMPQPGDTAKAAGQGGQKTIAGIPADFVYSLSSGELNFKPGFEPKKESKWIKTFEQFKKK
jgi:hypothetical protein